MPNISLHPVESVPDASIPIDSEPPGLAPNPMEEAPNPIESDAPPMGPESSPLEPMEDTIATETPPVKRGRGRPKKVPAPPAPTPEPVGAEPRSMLTIEAVPKAKPVRSLGKKKVDTPYHGERQAVEPPYRQQPSREMIQQPIDMHQAVMSYLRSRQDQERSNRSAMLASFVNF